MQHHFLSYFDSWTLAKGNEYFRRGKVLYQVRKPNGTIEGVVSGSNDRRYTVLLTLTAQTQEISKSSCTCPMGLRCKHGAAVAFDYLDDAKTDNIHKPFSLIDSIGSQPHASGQSTAAKTIEETDVWSPGRLSSVKDSYIRVAEMLRSTGKLAATNENGKESIKPTSTVIYLLKERTNNPVPVIELKKVALRKDDSLGAEAELKFERLTDTPTANFLDQQDVKIGRLWSTISLASMRSAFGSYALDSEPELFTLLVTNIITTGRCYVNSKESEPLKLGKPLEGKLAWQVTGDEQRLSVVAVDGAAQFSCLHWRSPWYLNALEGVCGPVILDIPPLILSSLLMAPPITIGDAPALQLFFAHTGLDRVLPAPISGKAVKTKLISPKHTLDIKMMKYVQTENQRVSEPGVPIKVLRIESTLPTIARVPKVLDDGSVEIEQYENNPQQVGPMLAEMGFREIPAASLGKPANEARYFSTVTTQSWLDFAESNIDQLRDSGWQLPEDIDDHVAFVDFDSSNLTLGVESEDSWWFTLSLTLESGGEKFSLLPLLVAAINSLPRTGNIDAASIELLNHNGKFVTILPNGKFLAMPFDRISAILLSVGEMVAKESKSQKLKMSVVDAEALLKSSWLTNARWVGAERIRKMAACLRQLADITPVDPPKEFNASLRPYQIDGLSWLQVLAQNELGGVLADDMGLGKTVQLLAHICLEKENKRLKKPFLVICPTSVLPNWLSEAQKFCPQLNVVPFSGLARQARWKEAKSADLVVSTYALVTRDLDLIKSVPWHGIALDESQAIKNSSSQISQIVGSIPANHRFCMTGTPIENHLGELWSQYRFLLPGLLGDQASFQRSFRRPIEQLADVATKTLLARRIRPFMMRRTKNEVAAELPDKTTIVQSIELEGAQRDLYETVRLASTKAVREQIQKNGFKQSQIMILDALLKLRQVCCDPRLVKLSAAKEVTTSTKLEILIEKLLELADEGRRVLVFSQFTSMLDLIARELEENSLQFVELRGDTTDRATPVKRFQNGEVPVFLISLKAGGTGLNLTAADTVIHYDPWWNPAVEEQATDRAHRIGQTKNVFVYKLIAQGTIEQRMLELQDRKRDLASSVLDETGSQKLNFSEQDLDYLLAPIES